MIRSPNVWTATITPGTSGSPALVDSTLGQGHVVLFSFNPAWRSQTHGSYFFFFNALLNWKNLDAKKK